MPSSLHPRTVELMAAMSPDLAGADAAQTVIDALVRELARVEAAAEALRDNFFPYKADEYLDVWEDILGVTTNPADKTLTQRQTTVAAFYGSLAATGSGEGWVAALTRLIGTSWSYIEDAAAYRTTISLPYSPELESPTVAPTVTPSGSAGGPTVTYAYTALSPYGETDASPESAAVTLNSDGDVVVDWEDTPLAVGYNVYRAEAGGSLFRIAENVAASTYTDAGDEATTARPPTHNQSRSPQAYEAVALARQVTPAHIELVFGYGAGFLLGISRVGEEPL